MDVAAQTAAVMADIEAEQARLRRMLAGRSQQQLDARPNPGKWSVMENVRHLLFAEQAHLQRFTGGEPVFSANGIPPDGMRGQKRLQHLTDTGDSTASILDEWAAFHAGIRDRLDTNAADLEFRLSRHLRHLRTHITVIERLLRKLDRA